MALTVLQVVPAMVVGGVETGTVDMARGLISRGHRAIVISSGGPLVANLEAAGAIHYTLPVHRKDPWTIWKMSRRLAEVVESHGVDVIHARSRVPAIIAFFAWRQVAARAGFRLGGRQRVPCFVTTAHGYYSTHLFSRVMGWGRLVIAISERIARHMMDEFRVPSARVRLVPRGVDLGRYPWREPRKEAPKGEWKVSVIGRITPIKGHRDLIRAFAIVSKTFPRATLQVVGSPPSENDGYFKELQAMTVRLGIKDRVLFAGTDPDVPKQLAQADVVVLPSTGQEAFGRVLIEASAAGVPVVATRVGGVAEVVADRKTGLLVPPGDPMAMSAAIIALLKDRKLAAEFSRQARKRVESLYPLERMVEQTLDVYRDASERLRILVIKLSAIGDVVLVTASLRALRARFPKAHISVLVGREGRELLHRCPYVDDLIMFDRHEKGPVAGVLQMGKKLRGAQVDLVVDFQNNRTSHWLGWLSGAPQRYGYAGRRWSWLLTHRATHPAAPMPPVEHQFRLLDLLGIQGAAPHLELWPGPQDEARVDELLKGAWISEGQPLIAVHPGAQWASKRWPADRYAQLIDILANAVKARVVLTGSEQERPIADSIYRQTKVKPILLVGSTSLNELAALMRRCRAFVGGDSAVLHVAAAVGTPLVTIFGPTDPVRHLPPSPDLKLLKKELPCSPCYRRTCHRGGAGHMECMSSIPVEQVAEAVLAHLQ